MIVCNLIEIVRRLLCFRKSDFDMMAITKGKTINSLWIKSNQVRHELRGIRVNGDLSTFSISLIRTTCVNNFGSASGCSFHIFFFLTSSSHHLPVSIFCQLSRKMTCRQLQGPLHRKCGREMCHGAELPTKRKMEIDNFTAIDTVAAARRKRRHVCVGWQIDKANNRDY